MRRPPRLSSPENKHDAECRNDRQLDLLERGRSLRTDGQSVAIAHPERVADRASDLQLTAWLDVAALSVQYRRAFALACCHRLAQHGAPLGAKTPEQPDDDSAHAAPGETGGSAPAIASDCVPAGDFARQWLARNGLPSSYRREPAMDPLSEKLDQGPYGTTRVAAVRAWLRMPNRHVLTILDLDYPKRLRHLDDPPPMLYVQGALEWLHRPMIAIVGSRRATAQGQESAAFLAAELAGRGWSIVSGLASGIDAAAHRATLSRMPRRAIQSRSPLHLHALPPFETGSDSPALLAASTIAVIGTGIDQTYPASNTALRDAIARHGAILSEWPLGTPPKAAHFPQRNRLIAALAEGVVVVEAALRSGSLITARLANELGREVFALPGSIFSPQAKGCHALIKEGATLVESVDDILDGLPPHAASDRPPDGPPGRTAADSGLAEAATASTSALAAARPRTSAAPGVPQTCPSHLTGIAPAAAPAPHDTQHDEPVLVALGHDAVALDVICARTGLPASTVAARLAAYEIDGLISSAGGRFTRLHAVSSRTMPRNVLKSTLSEQSAQYGRRTVKGPIRASTGNVVESAADSAPRQTEADESVIRPGQP